MTQALADGSIATRRVDPAPIWGGRPGAETPIDASSGRARRASSAWSDGRRFLDAGHLMAGFGAMGYLTRKLGYEPAPLVLGFVLGPLLENNLRKSLILSRGDFSIFLDRPISAACLIVALLLLISPLVPGLRRRRTAIAVQQVS